MDGDVLAAGCTGPAHGDTLEYAVSIRDDRYTWHRAGFRLVDLVVPWAAEHGFAKFDVGGWYSYYKAKWGPQDGEHWYFRICPLRQHLREQVIWKARAVPSKLKALLGWLPGISRTPEGDEGEDVGGSQAEDAPETESGNTGQVPSPIADASKGPNA
jgi:hypothetical protein